MQNLQNLINYFSYSSGPDNDLEVAPVIQHLCNLSGEPLKTVKLPADVWQEIVNNLSVISSRNISLVAKQFEPMIDKNLFPLCKLIFNSAKPFLGKQVSRPYDWCIGGESFGLKFPLTLTKRDEKGANICIFENCLILVDNGQAIEEFRGFRCEIKNKSISEKDKINFNKVISFLDEKAESPSKNIDLNKSYFNWVIKK